MEHYAPKDVPPSTSAAAAAAANYDPTGMQQTQVQLTQQQQQQQQQSSLPPGLAASQAFRCSSSPPLPLTTSCVTGSSVEVLIDFTRPDSARTRPLLVEGRRLYVDDHYIGVWSPVLRSWCVECPDRELILANVQYEHVLEMLEVIHPSYKPVDAQSVQVLLPLAYDYQMEGLLHLCECFLVLHQMPFLDKVWLADRYKLNRLLVLCLRQLRPNQKMEFQGPKYYGLSDRVKVLLLETLHGSVPPEEIVEKPVDLEALCRPSDLNFVAIRGTNGRSYYVNPFYVSAWSPLFQDKVYDGTAGSGEMFCPCSHEELKAFLMAIYPPQLRINESNIGPVLMAGCKMESRALLRKCANLLLTPATQLSVFVRVSLLDRCFLFDLVPSCLLMLHRPEHVIHMTQQQTYPHLSPKSRAAMLDRLAVLLAKPGLQPHNCQRCKQQSPCTAVTWQCPHCKSYSSDGPLTRAGQQQQQLQNGSAGGGPLIGSVPLGTNLSGAHHNTTTTTTTTTSQLR